uniref:Uncharacterized protein n=1 Tax=Globisporangium ultimum (strain ATCC 200006 / CBS 805.95 / DAOM BR144) TaxID=431595 RepID=K3WHA5_GLOUD
MRQWHELISSQEAKANSESDDPEFTQATPPITPIKHLAGGRTKRGHVTTPMDKTAQGPDLLNRNNPAVPIKKGKTNIPRLEDSLSTVAERKKQRQRWEQLWDKQQSLWSTHSEYVFPTMTAPPSHWQEVLRAEPDKMLELVQHFPSPAFLLERLTDATLVAWTTQRRIRSMMARLAQLMQTTTSEDQKRLAQKALEQLEQTVSTEDQEWILQKLDIWTSLRKGEYGGSFLFRKCDPVNAEGGNKHF